MNAHEHTDGERRGGPSETRIDWSRFSSFLFRFVAGLGLICFWLLLLGGTVIVLVYAGKFVATLSISWLLGVVVAVGVVGVLWYVCFWVAVDALSDMGIHLDGLWTLLVVPVAPLLATVAFAAVYLSGIGRWVSKPLFVGVSFVGGVVFLLLIMRLLLW
jgi:hypothetical protein